MPLTKIISVDMSYRDTGVCYIENDRECCTIVDAYSIKNDAMDCGFEGLRLMARRVNVVVNEIRRISMDKNPHVVLVELPCFTQNAKAAISIGLCWAAIININCILVEPSFLKIWSSSESGDGKKKVKEKVRTLTNLDKAQLSNDNIVDAVGIGLAFVELINKP